MKLSKKRDLFVIVLLLSMILFFSNVGLANDIIDAAYNNDLEKVKALVKNGTDINITNDYDKTALMYAAANGNLEIATLLIKNGADINKNEYSSKKVIEVLEKALDK